MTGKIYIENEPGQAGLGRVCYGSGRKLVAGNGPNEKRSSRAGPDYFGPCIHLLHSNQRIDVIDVMHALVCLIPRLTVEDLLVQNIDCLEITRYS